MDTMIAWTPEYSRFDMMPQYTKTFILFISPIRGDLHLQMSQPFASFSKPFGQNILHVMGLQVDLGGGVSEK